MANTLTPTDIYAIVNAAAAEMYGANSSIQAVDTRTFVTVGENMLRTGYTNTLNALSNVIGRTIIGIRPYKGDFELITKTPAEWGGIERKISFYASKFEASKNFNTDINGSQLVDGASIDHYAISKVYPLELNFCGIKVLEKTYTTFRKQLKLAFTSESEFAKFYGGMMVAIANDIALGYEGMNRDIVLNAIGATYNNGATRSKVNLVTAYNAKYGTTYTATQLMTTYFKEFCEFFVAKIRGDMSLMERYNELFHIYPARNDDGGNALTLLRHTPSDMRRLLLYMPMWRDAETRILPAIFHDGYLKLEDYEGVEFWQNPNVPAAVSVTPNQLNASTGQSENGTAVALDNVVALLFDRDALETSIKLEDVLTTPVNAKGDYYNTVYHWGFNFKFDMTENMILYYVA